MTDDLDTAIIKGLAGAALLSGILTAGLFSVWGTGRIGWQLVGVPWVIGIVVGLLVARAGPPGTPRGPGLSQRSVPALAGIGLILAAVIKSDKIMSGICVVALALMVAGLFALLGRFVAIRLGLDNKPSTEP